MTRIHRTPGTTPPPTTQGVKPGTTATTTSTPKTAAPPTTAPTDGFDGLVASATGQLAAAARQTFGLDLPLLEGLDPRRLLDGRVELTLQLADGMTFTLPGPHGRPIQLQIPRSPYGTELRAVVSLGPATTEGGNPTITSASITFDTPGRTADPTKPAIPASAYPRVLNPTALQPPSPGRLAALVARAKDSVADLELRGLDVDAQGRVAVHGGVVAMGREVSSLQALAGDMLPTIQTDVAALARGEVIVGQPKAQEAGSSSTPPPGPGLDALLRAFSLVATGGAWRAELALSAPDGARAAIASDGHLILNRDLSLTATASASATLNDAKVSAQATTRLNAITGDGGLSVSVDRGAGSAVVGGLSWNREGMTVDGVDVDALLPVALQPWRAPEGSTARAPRLGSPAFADRIGALLDKDAPAVDGATVRILGSGTDVLAERLALLDKAGPGDTVMLQTFIFKDDVTGSQVTDALIRAKARGADVRVLIDAVGSMKGAADLVAGPPAYQRLKAAGVDARLFQHPAAALVRDDAAGPLVALGTALRAVSVDARAAAEAGTLPELVRSLATGGAPGLVSVLETLSTPGALEGLANNPAALLRFGSVLLGAGRELANPLGTAAAVLGEPLAGHLKTLLLETDVKEIVRGLGRDHRKQLVVFGERDGVPFASMGTGGNNIGDDYQVERGDKNHRDDMDHVFWNDAELMIDSIDAVAGSAARFDLTWQAAGGDKSQGLDRLKSRSSLSSSSEAGPKGGERIRVVHHEPVAMRGEDGDDHYLNAVLATLEGAGAGDKIAIENPYFMPLPALRDAMIAAAKRGARITVVTNGLTDNNDGKMVARLSRRFSMRELVETKGIEVYETLGTADPVHRKTLVAVDKRGKDMWVVGSHNLDPLSARINREMFVVGGAALDPAAQKTSKTGQALLDDAVWDTLARASRRVTAEELKPGPVEGVVSDYLLSLLSPVL